MSNAVRTLCVIGGLLAALIAIPVDGFAQSSDTGNKGNIVREFQDAFNARDVEAMSALVTEDVQWLAVQDGDVSIFLDGRASLAASMREYFASCPSCRSEIRGVTSSNERVSLVEVASWVGADGPRSQQSMAVYEFAGELIKRIYYFPSEPVVADKEADMTALRKLDQAYATMWKAGDADGVMALFTEDATLVPHHGDEPIKGHKAIRDFWFNPAYPPTVVPVWIRKPAEFFVSGDVGVVRGTARLVWEYDGTRTTIPNGNYVLIAVRLEDGWRIRMLTWNDDPRKWEQEPID